MRTLALLAALLLLASQARARTLQESADQLPAQDQPAAEDQNLLGVEDQAVALSFTGRQHLAPGAAGRQSAARREVCSCRIRCRLTIFGQSFERPSGRCKVYGRRYKLCCR